MSISADRRAVTFPERSGRTVPVMSQAAPVAAPGPAVRPRWQVSPATALAAGAVLLALMIAEFPLASLAHQTVDAGGAARALARRHRILQAILVPAAHRLMRYRTVHYELIP